MSVQLFLASASPRRQALLSQLGVAFTVARQDIDETQRANESPTDFVQRMAAEKADSALDRLQSTEADVVIAADTIVLCDQEVMGKPLDCADTVRMLLQLSNRDHHVLSAVTMATAKQHSSALSDSIVSFRSISPDQAEHYWQTGEPEGKAGAYAIQGLAAVFVKRIAGSYSGVMGLPLYETAQLLEEFGFPCLPPLCLQPTDEQ